MATTPEGKVKAKVKTILKNCNAYFYMPATGGFGRSGNFDFTIVYKGVPIGVETKATAKDMPTTLQTHNAKLFYQAGGISLCIHADNLHVLEDVLRSVEEHGVNADRVMVWPLKETD